MEAKAESYQFGSALDQEDNREHDIDLREELIPGRDVLWLDSLLVVCEGEKQGVQQDDEGNEPIEPLPLHEPNERIADLEVSVEDV